MSGKEWQQPEQAAQWSQRRRLLIPAGEAEAMIVHHRTGDERSNACSLRG
jgi:hypothetical protein